MKILTGLLFATSLLSAETLSQDERNKAMSHLHATRKMFLDSIAGLSAAQWNYKPGPDRWSIAEVAEHITISEDSLFELVSKKIMSMPVADATTLAATKGKEELLMKAMPDRSRKAQAPEFLKPASRWKSADEVNAHFKESRDRTIAYVQDTKEDLRAHATPHPAFQALDAYQWLILISTHSERHVLQIKEVKESAGYPKK